MKRWILPVLLLLTLIFVSRPAAGQFDPPSCSGDGADLNCGYVVPPEQPSPPPPGDGGGGGGGEGPPPQPIVNPPPPPPPCEDFARYVKILPVGDVCYFYYYTVDCETGDIVPLESGTGPCPQPEEPTAEDPCKEWHVSDSALVCSGVGDELEARVSLPPFTLDLYPWPASLVGWPSLLRLAWMGSDTGRDTRDYIARAGGSPDSPKVGDWRKVVFTLSLKPVPPGVVQIIGLPGTGDGELWLQMGQPPTPITFELPSHPDAGGVGARGPAQQVGLPDDFPAFRATARGAYTLSWSLTWEEYVRKKVGEECKPVDEDEHVDPDERCTLPGDRPGKLKDIYEYEWKGKAAGGIIDPDWVTGLPAEYKADLNRDGDPEAFWSYNVQQRTMDEHLHPAGPARALGGFYWWVREAQGVIGWTGGR